MAMGEDGNKAAALQQSFIRLNEISGAWTKDSKILVAVSGGVDSMVLLHLLLIAKQQAGFSLSVVHVDHQLREASAQEAAYVKRYCREKDLTLHPVIWEKPADHGIETAARQFRYDTFAQLMEEHHYDTLMTAHHGDDQIETILMKILRGGQLRTFSGIKSSQKFSVGKLVRPLLGFSKAQLYAYAKAKQLVYFEDPTNQELDVQRNRLRHLVVPQLKKENSQAIAHFQDFSNQIQQADLFIQKQVRQLIEKNVVESPERFELPTTLIRSLASYERYFFFQGLFDWAFPQTEIVIKEQQLKLILTQLDHPKGQWQIDIGNDWVLRQVYEQVVLEKKNLKERSDEESEKFLLVPNQKVYVSETEWIGLFSPELAEKEAQTIHTWSEFSHDLWLAPDQQLFADKRKPGDRIQLTEKLSKKISRYFIDRKIPDSQRKQAWVVTDEERNIYSLLPFAYSHLSISAETDKIHYILLYKYQKEAIGRRN
ncbi:MULTISPECIES: tRNA lysidine(34) synthetase TilS [unclassified Enterococcus]|uniref:tRNA lysidine(34) synthetase TilS n=1 Tax=unclassified Enterococcus TaxID=2608891 RepID=UPI002405E4ED|nr:MULTISPECIES: tRNA lysidine(34) synthetase TilS [unclassified Enterococcus]